MAAVRAELGSTVLWEQLARRIGGDAAVLAGTRTFRGVTVASYLEFLVLQADDGSEHLIRHGPAVTVALPPEPPTLRPRRARHTPLPVRPRPPRAAPAPGAGRVELADGTSCDGTIEAVGSDYLSWPSTTSARRDVAWPSGPAASSGSPRSSPSPFLRRADERVLARPVGRLPCMRSM